MSPGAQVYPIIDEERCTGCGECVDACPTGALQLVEGQAALTEPEACAYCADCEDLCPQGAIGLPYEVEFEEKKESLGE
jgi:NAD-dependent dihydropyrimidine dehydrogenase PreA subunit